MEDEIVLRSEKQPVLMSGSPSLTTMEGQQCMKNRTRPEKSAVLLAFDVLTHLFVYTVLSILFLTLRLSEGAVLKENKASDSTAVATPCWQVEEFVVAQACGLCTDFQKKTMEVCHTTGFVEKINCALSKKDEYKSCRSAMMEDEVFWKFEGAMAGVAVMFAVVVIFRQRALDKLASEKVRRQLESI